MEGSWVIRPEDSTVEINDCVAKLRCRMAWTCTLYEEEDILVLAYGDDVYILANPVLGSEPIYDEFGRVIDRVPMRNITLIWQEDWLKGDASTLTVTLPRLRILRPDLCTRLNSGKTTVGPVAEMQSIIEEEEVVRLEDMVCSVRRGIWLARAAGG